jgi:hypothetical protein
MTGLEPASPREIARVKSAATRAVLLPVVDLAGYKWMFTIAGMLCAAGFILIWKQWAKLK